MEARVPRSIQRHTQSTRAGWHGAPHCPAAGRPHTLNNSGNDAAGFHITVTCRLDCVATHSQGQEDSV